ERTVSRRKKDYGIMDSHTTTCTLPDTVKSQLVVDQLEMDPGRRQGPAVIKESIRMKTGYDLTRALVNLGIHEEWSGDGHNKLKRIGFAIYGIRDVWSGKWPGLWVIPDNRLKDAVAYLWLSLVEEYEGLPIQTTTDCSSETTLIYGLATALREAFFPDFPIDEVPAHRFLRSIHNITIERGWSQLKFQFDADVDEFWDRASLKAYMTHIIMSTCNILARWLWSVLIHKEINNWKDRFNAHTPRRDLKKVNPSGVSPNVAFTLYEKYGGINYACKLIHDLKKHLGAEELLQFIPPAFAERCHQALASLNLNKLTFTNVLAVFRKLLPLVFEEEL
ncbi:hypothetical protein M422DRAFT_194010, partial [Sphaerobolus stellatus SS14]